MSWRGDPFGADPPWMRALDWLRDRRHDPRSGVVVLVLLAVVAGFVWYRLGATGGAAPARQVAASAPREPAAPRTDAAPTTTTISPDGPILVHVAGAVARAGVVELSPRARVIDAVEAVGGATAEGDLDRLNLAAPVADGSRVYVPRVGEADTGVLGGTGGGATSGAAGTTSGATRTPSPTAKLNLNTATQAELEALPGIGPAYAQAILVERARRGGFTSVNELREVRGIGEKRFADLAPLVTV